MNVFDLYAAIKLDVQDYEKGLADAGGKMSDFGGKLKNGFKTAAKVTGAAVATASAAAAKLTQVATSNYANYEQLVGGVETLFGAGGKSLEEYAQSVGKTVSEASEEYSKLGSAQKAVLENAAKAYTTAGMSQNEYMETVTSFSASLIQSLDGDTAKAASLADQAIIDMSDKMSVRLKRIELCQRCAA